MVDQNKTISSLEASDEDIQDSLMAQYLHYFISRRKNKEKQKSYYNNIILFDTQRPEKLKNSVLSFDPVKINPIFNLTNIQLSSLVPVIQIFKIYKKKDGNEELEVVLPFPEYTYKEDLDQLFESRTGRGAGVGIKSFEWTSQAKNQANLAQFSADLELYLQDASELTKIRNQVTDGKSTYNASILDLLYPVNKDGKKDSFEYDPTNFFLKVKVGWQLKNDIQDSNLKIDNNLLRSFVSEYHLSLYKHDIDFAPDGSVSLKIKFIAIAEALLDDYGKSDIFFNRFLDESSTQKIKDSTNKVRELRKQLRDEKLDTQKKKEIEEEINKEQSNIENIEEYQKTTKKYIYKYFLTWLIKTERLEFFELPKFEKNELKILSTYRSQLLESDDITAISESINQRNEKALLSGQSQLSAEDVRKTQISIIEKETANDEKGDKNLAPDQVVEAIKKSYIDKYQNTDGGNLIVPYFHVGDMLEYFMARYADTRPETAATTIPSGKNINNKKTRLVLGTFSYSDFGNPQIAFQNGGIAYQTRTVKKGESKKIVSLTGKKEIANIAHIPISFKSFLLWFDKKIVDGNLEKYSLNKFIRDVIYELVPSNLTNRILKATPAVKLRVTMNTESVDDNTKYASNQTIVNFLDNSYETSNSNYIVNFDDFVSKNPFEYLKSTKSEAELFKSENDKARNIANYIFLFSNNEISEQLNRDYNEDLQNNILHFYVGEETGMIKEIKFSREDNPRLDAHNIQVANQENAGAIIRNVYNANIEMFGNNIFVPGNMIFVNPTFPGMRLGDSTLLRLGLGGYFIILKTTNKISSGSYTTSIETKWQSFGAENDPAMIRKLTPADIDNLKRLGYTAQFIGIK